MKEKRQTLEEFVDDVNENYIHKADLRKMVKEWERDRKYITVTNCIVGVKALLEGE